MSVRLDRHVTLVSTASGMVIALDADERIADPARSTDADQTDRVSEIPVASVELDSGPLCRLDRPRANSSQRSRRARMRGCTDRQRR